MLHIHNIYIIFYGHTHTHTHTQATMAAIKKRERMLDWGADEVLTLLALLVQSTCFTGTKGGQSVA